MKQRTGFVSNSSSSSFIIERGKLTDHQIWQIRNHIQQAELFVYWGKKNAKKLFIYPNLGDAWDVTVTETQVELDTNMDNFEMGDFLDFIGVPSDAYILKNRDGDW